MTNQDEAFHSTVKRALVNFHDLAYLRKHPLCNWVPANLAAGSDRVKALRQWLQEAVQYLKPAGTPSETAKEWRPYFILYYRHIEGLSRQQVMARLNIGKSEFYRQWNAAIAAVADWLEQSRAQTQPPAVQIETIPKLKHFIGRQKELAFYRRQLERDNCVFINGLAGVGKTSLGAELASEWQEEGHVIWFRFWQERNTNLEAILEGLALSLAALGQDEYWRFLQADRQRSSPSSSDIRIRYLISVLSRGNHTLCFDNFEAVGGNAMIHSLFRDLLRNARSGKLRLMVMSRVTPAFASGRATRPLGGLCREDARQLLAVSGIGPLPEAIFARLYTKTGGLPVFLKLFASWIHSQGLLNVGGEWVEGQVQTCVDYLVRQYDVRYYLLQQVYETLDSVEQRFLEIVSAFRLPFDEREEQVLRLLAAVGIEDVAQTLDGLLSRHLFTIDETDNLYLHPLIGEYCYSRLAARPADKIRLHGRLAAYYEQSVGDVLEAGHHYSEAGEYERAARLVSENVAGLIDAGRAEAALEQLERLALSWRDLARAAEADLRFEVAAAREALCHLLGRREKQEAALRTMCALALSGELDDTQRLALAYNRRSRLHEATGDYPAAIAAAEVGLAAARRAGDSAVEAKSLALWGKALWCCGEYDEAREQLEQALALAREAGEQPVEAESLNNLGAVCYGTGNYTAAQEYHEQALALRRALGDRQGEAKCLSNLSAVCFGLGDYAAVREYQEQVLAIGRAIGDRRGEASSLNNLGVICRRLGDHVAARECHEQSLVIARVVGDRQGEASSLNNLGNVCYDLGDYPAAREHYEWSLAVKRAIGDRRGEAASLNNLGGVCRQEGDYEAARAYHEQSLAIRQAIGDRQGAGYVLSYLGVALEGLGEMGEAEAAYRGALTIRRELGQTALAVDSLAGLARVALAKESREGREEARQYAEECLAHIAAHGVDGIEYPVVVYHTCARILAACGGTYTEQARVVLEEAHTLLMERADKIGDQNLRRSFLENVPAHREVIREWETGKLVGW